MKKVYQKKLFSWGCMLICFRPLLFFIFLVLLHWKYVHHVKERILLRTNMYVLLGTVQKSGHIRYVRAHCNILVCFRTIHGILSWKELSLLSNYTSENLICRISNNFPLRSITRILLIFALPIFHCWINVEQMGTFWNAIFWLKEKLPTSFSCY